MLRPPQSFGCVQPKHTALGGAFQTLTYMWVITNPSVLTIDNCE
jgi:hypothetical protein